MSKLDKIRVMLQSVLATFERIATDKGLLSFDGDELEVGMKVNVVDEEGNESPAPAGEYATDEGTIYVINEESIVAEIREADGQEESETTGDDVQPEAETEEEINAEDTPEEEAPAEEEADPRDQRIADLEAEVARLEEENGALRERIAELENKPAAEPAAEEFEKVNKVEKTGNRKLDNLNRILNA